MALAERYSDSLIVFVSGEAADLSGLGLHQASVALLATTTPVSKMLQSFDGAPRAERSTEQQAQASNITSGLPHFPLNDVSVGNREIRLTSQLCTRAALQ